MGCDLLPVLPTNKACHAQMLLPVSCVNIDSPHGAGAPTQKHALCNRMLDDTGCQVAPGVETASDRNMRVLTGTFTQV